MNNTPNILSCGLYGKLPAKGDFVTRRLPHDFVTAWDDWLQEGLTLSRDRFGDRWLDAYLVSPVWCFVLPAGQFGTAAIAGVIIPSIDRVGRYFPLTLAVPLGEEVNLLQLAAFGGPWFEAAEDLALSSLEDDLGFDRFDQAVADLGSPDGMPAQPPVKISASVWKVGLVPEGGPAAGLLSIAGAALGEMIGSYSIWWTAGSAEVPPSLVVRHGAPCPADYIALIDGVWQSLGPEAAGNPGTLEEAT
jgi:type VI secretion system protein ImpM